MTFDHTLHADHTLLLALPAFAPAVVVVGVVLFVAMRDRRTPDDTTPRDDGSARIDDDAHTNDDV